MKDQIVTSSEHMTYLKQYEQQKMKINSLLFSTPLLKAQNDKIC